MPEDKTLSQRVAECVDVRSVLTRMGIMASEENRLRFAAASNAFVRTGEGSTTDLSVGEGEGAPVARMQLTRRAGVQSGVTLIR